jgi:hypothetical protein
MKDSFIELKSTENQTIFVRKSAVGAFEVAPPTTHVEGHIKLYVGGQKFLVNTDKNDLLNKLNE